jgi:hypothetical protein
MKKQDAGMNLRSHSLDKLRQIITTGAWIPAMSMVVVLRRWHGMAVFRPRTSGRHASSFGRAMCVPP